MNINNAEYIKPMMLLAVKRKYGNGHGYGNGYGYGYGDGFSDDDEIL